MPFRKGQKHPNQGGRRDPPGGRPTKEQAEIKQKAAELAREYIEEHIKPVLETYVGLAAGKIIERRTAHGKKKFKLSVDPASTRDYVGKFVPEAAKTLHVKEELTIDDLLLKAAERKHGSRNR